MMITTLIGFLLALLLLTLIVLRSDPTCLEWMFRLAERPIPLRVHRPARRVQSSATPWRFYSIMAPPGAAEPFYTVLAQFSSDAMD